MAQCNLSSPHFESLQINSGLTIAENNNANTHADSSTPLEGFFITPSTVAGRPADITGYIVTSTTAEGKVGFTAPTTFAGSILLGDFSDTHYTGTPAQNNIFTYDLGNTRWTNTNTATLTGLTVSTSTQLGSATSSLVGFFGRTPIARPAVSTQDTTFVAATGGIPATGDATYYGGYTAEGFIQSLIDVGLLA